MSDDLIQITVDGKSLKARKGQMLIEVTDDAGIDIPRFCYHKKLSVAANCRMCLVEVEKAPKPLPACATPVMPDMVVHTKSKAARKAQRGTMEFLLINHPLDCPICDQGGECELQDVALGYGDASSQYTEEKRVVMDKYIGPLIATEMTRCIHCTRCVRFGEEIAGMREMGATGRGENVRIGTYIEKSIVSEVSGNIIDVCPVGALTARPSRFSARAWELSQHASVSPHDSVGANIFIHTDKKTVNRVVPRENESINEVWIADRDRFAYQGLIASDRITRPLLRVDGELVETDLESALDAAQEALAAAGSDVCALASAYSTLEELYLLQKLVRGLGSSSVDHRLAQQDFTDQHAAPIMPWLGMDFSELEDLQAALLVGSNIRKEQPIAALRLRKAALKGAPISLLNTRKASVHFDALENMSADPYALLLQLAGILKASGGSAAGLDVPDVDVSDAQQRIADSLKNNDKSVVFIGPQAVSSSYFSVIRSLAAAIAKATDSSLAYLPEAGNTAAAWLAGCVPHRRVAGGEIPKSGKNAAQIMADPGKALLLLATELELDAASGQAATAALEKAEKVIVLGSYLSPAVAAAADVVLPQASYAESAGTYVNASGRWQFVRGAAKAAGDSRPGWKLLRALGSNAELEGFDFDSIDQISQEVQAECASIGLSNELKSVDLQWPEHSNKGLIRIGGNTLYSTDSIVRRSTSLQKTEDARVFLSLNPETADKLSLADGDTVIASQGKATSSALPLQIDPAVPADCVWIPTGICEVTNLGAVNSPIQLDKV
ncbi:unnamed protein product [Cyprideis torosa]|uniref:NADH-ubiquinone oxidoreductase 75 kDa subunit, mitochondrial n=1 Tax=Cyprideis torosa TaxID=163714 RepID=A0A7R8ZFC2_9CRUS|nr:unnamed protein product [Cyprideis torosa]CAG0878748.1 unnamed protein product [Cyprideis torosa]